MKYNYEREIHKEQQNNGAMREVFDRLARMESRLCQLMLHVGLDPQKRMYDLPKTS